MDYETRVRQLEAEGLTRSDAQGVVDAEDLKAKHTPTPWDICESNNSNLIHIETHLEHGPKGRCGEQIATVNKGSREERVANALHIVKCVNSHEALLTALKEAA